MRIGNMDTRLSIEQAPTVRTRSGEQTLGEFSPIAEVWGGEISMKAAERYTGQQVIAVADVAFVMRSWPGPEKFGPEERFRLVVDRLPYYVNAVVRVRGRRSNGGFIAYTSTRQEITNADGSPVEPVE